MHPQINSPEELALFLWSLILCVVAGAIILFCAAAALAFVYGVAKTIFKRKAEK